MRLRDIGDRKLADALMAMGCALGQGYFFGRPMTPADFELWLGRHRVWTSESALAALPAPAGAPVAVAPPPVMPAIVGFGAPPGEGLRSRRAARRAAQARTA